MLISCFLTWWFPADDICKEFPLLSLLHLNALPFLLPIAQMTQGEVPMDKATERVGEEMALSFSKGLGDDELALDGRCLEDAFYCS